MMLLLARRVHLAARPDLQPRLRPRRPPVHPLLRRPHAVLGGMLIMVLAENMVQLILGWEIMGLCSFMLIGHWWEEEANSRAALKAFFTVRVGDVGLLVGTIIIFFGANQWAQRQPRQQRLQHLGDPGVGAVRRGIEHGAARGRGRTVHRLHRQVGSVPAAHLAARRHGRTDAGRRRCCTARPWSSPACSSSPGSTRSSGRVQHRAGRAVNHRRDRRRSRSSSPRCWRSCRTTSRRCSPTRRCRSSAT